MTHTTLSPEELTLLNRDGIGVRIRNNLQPIYGIIALMDALGHETNTDHRTKTIALLRKTMPTARKSFEIMNAHAQNHHRHDLKMALSGFEPLFIAVEEFLSADEEGMLKIITYLSIETYKEIMESAKQCVAKD